MILVGTPNAEARNQHALYLGTIIGVIAVFKQKLGTDRAGAGVDKSDKDIQGENKSKECGDGRWLRAWRCHDKAVLRQDEVTGWKHDKSRAAFK